MRAPSSLQDSGGLEYLQELSCGSFGALWLARRLSGSEVGRLVVARRLALNQLDAPSVDRVLAVARDYSSLSHPQLVKNLGGLKTDTDLVLLEEHLIGVPLGKLQQLALTRQSSMPTGVGVKLVLDALRAAVALRRSCSNQGLASPGRTIFPDSVMVANFGEALLSGVGVTEELCQCRRVREHPDLVDVLDPSAADGVGGTDERVEVFTAGALLWKLLLIRGLFNDYSNRETLGLVLHSNVLLEEYDERLNLCVPKPIANVIRRATQKSLSLRYPSLQEMIQAIEALPPPLLAGESQVRVWLESIAGDYLSDVQHSSGVRPIPLSLQSSRLPTGASRRPSFYPTPLPGFHAPVTPGLATLQLVGSKEQHDTPLTAPNGQASQPVNSTEGGSEGESASRRPIRKAYFVGALLGIVASLGLGYLVSWLGSRLTTADNDASPSGLQNRLERPSTHTQALVPSASAQAGSLGPTQERSTVAQIAAKHTKSLVAPNIGRDAKQTDTTERANRAQTPATNAAKSRPTNAGSVNRWGI